MRTGAVLLLTGTGLSLIYLATSNGHPNGLFFLALLLIAVGAYLVLRQSRPYPHLNHQEKP